jgi:hypothetical protein
MDDITHCPNCQRIAPASTIHDGKCYYCIKVEDEDRSVSMMAMAGAALYGALVGFCIGYLL